MFQAILMSHALMAHQLVMAQTLGVPITISDEYDLLISDEHDLVRQSGGQLAEVIETVKARPARGLLVAPQNERPRRSRGPQAPAKRRPNRAHVSRRTRRKHRRAASA